MKLWFSLTLVGCALVCLFLSFTRVVGLNHPWQVVGSGPWLDRGREPASDAPTVSVVTSIEFDSARAGPWPSLAPRRCTDCGPSCSSRPGDPWATENR